MNAPARNPSSALAPERWEVLVAKHELTAVELAGYAATAACHCPVGDRKCAPCRARAFTAEFTGVVFDVAGRFVGVDDSRRVR